MMSLPTLQAGSTTQQSLSPRLQHAVRLLQMSSLDFAQVVRDAVGSNPFLEQDESAEEVHHEVAIGEAQDWGFGQTGRLPSAPAGEGNGFDHFEVPASLSGHLLGQVSVLALSRRDLALTGAVIESLDDDGYLRADLCDISASLDLLVPASTQEMSIALKRVQALDPAGVGARSVRECLRLQLGAIASPEVRALASLIVDHHLDALAARDMKQLSRKLDRSAAATEQACAAIRRFDPHPGWRYGAPSSQYITPDVLVRKVRGQWTVVLNEALVPRVKLNRSYADLFQLHRGEEHGELNANLQDAHWTVRNVEQRFSTILSVARAILEHQPHFLGYGPMALKPLVLREIAEELGVHESTVSRVTNNKFIATPHGVFELKYFFSRGLATEGGGECSPTAIRTLIGEMIGAEMPAAPLSDVEVARQLALQGIKVARRTVTKYRQLLSIEPVERRRDLAAA